MNKISIIVFLLLSGIVNSYSQDVKEIIIRKPTPVINNDYARDSVKTELNISVPPDTIRTSSIIGSWQFSINTSTRNTPVKPGFDTVSHSIGALCMFRENGTYKVWKPNVTIETGKWNLSNDQKILELTNRKIKKGQDKYFLSKVQEIRMGINNSFTLIEKAGGKSKIIAFEKASP